MNIAERLDVRRSEQAGCLVATLTGRLDTRSYSGLRDLLVKLALEEPRALIVDVDALDIHDGGALTVFPAAQVMVHEWPGVPVLLAAGDADRRTALGEGAAMRSVPVFTGVEPALDSVRTVVTQRRAAAEFPPLPSSAAVARRFARDICRYWRVPVAPHEVLCVVSELVENAVRHAATRFQLRLRMRDGMLGVAVHDGSPRPAMLRQGPSGIPAGFGLRIVAELARDWGCLPDLGNGKVVWAVLSGAEDWFRAHPPWPVDEP
ncbi:ATP-binding protein [Amycolatopsis pigmentata]|uniref:ATP-binding protein n=1 Tax=Amycolatopsis pigmentata TaxID=450801 RepID=A0ABW5FSM9_9PSEU